MNKAEELWQKQMYKESTPVEVMEIHAIDFAEWLNKECFFYVEHSKCWFQENDYDNNKPYSTKELYQIFNQTK
jgi:hypothetical protein